MIPGTFPHCLAACTLMLTLSLAGGSTLAAGPDAARPDAPDAVGTAAEAPRTAAPDAARTAPRVTRDATRPTAPDAARPASPDSTRPASPDAAGADAPPAARGASRVTRNAARPPLAEAASTGARNTARLRQRPRGQLAVPVKLGAFRVSQPFHRWHDGIDLAAPTGTPVRSVAHGRVVKVRKWRHSYGKHVVVKHPGGRSLSAHLSGIHVRKGQRVRPGQVIGRVGSTGNSTGPHLHFVLTKGGRTVNPAGYIWR